jgi:hypothetical protein
VKERWDLRKQNKHKRACERKGRKEERREKRGS